MFDSVLSELAVRGSATFTVRVRPGMPITKAVSVMDDASIKIDIAAPADGGKANTELVRFLAAECGVAKGNVKILSGYAERIKLIRITS